MNQIYCLHVAEEREMTDQLRTIVSEVSSFLGNPVSFSWSLYKYKFLEKLFLIYIIVFNANFLGFVLNC